MSKVVNVDIEPYHRERGMRLIWDGGFEIDASCEGGEVIVRANRAGLVSLARHLLTLAEEGVPSGSHIHLTAGQEMDDSSLDLVLERV